MYLNYALNLPQMCINDHTDAKDLCALDFHGPMVDHEPTAAKH